MVEQERIGRKRESDCGKPQGVHSGADQLFMGDVELTEHRHDRAGPDRMRSDRLDEGRQAEERAGRDQCPDQVKAPALCGCAQADREQKESHDAHSGEVVGE
ncbi:MAG: hypothetical protein E6G09_15440 [Actinobacteria bacterium]|nr:MAG: hypothetical protein E6G09_15440 [Actinomycetota bacterium]